MKERLTNPPKRPDLLMEIERFSHLKNVNYFDTELIESINYLERCPCSVYNLAAETAMVLAEHVDDFDYVVTTAGSRPISRVLLQAAGISPEKFISLDSSTNAFVYKLNQWDLKAIKPQQRAGILATRLAGLGVDFSKRPSICVVDERSITGIKAKDYLGILSLVNGIKKYGFSVFAVSGHTFSQILRNPNFYYAEKVFAKDPVGLFQFFDRLSRLQSCIHYEKAWQRENFSPEILKFTGICVRDALERLFHAASDKKFIQDLEI